MKKKLKGYLMMAPFIAIVMSIFGSFAYTAGFWALMGLMLSILGIIVACVLFVLGLEKVGAL